MPASEPHLPVLTFFNNKGGVGKTSLVYHVCWMLSELGYRVLAVDLDPQANLTAAFLEEDLLQELWNGADSAHTVFSCIQPLLEVGDVVEAKYQKIAANLALIPGDLELARFEDDLAEAWHAALSDRSLARQFRILSAFWRVAQQAGRDFEADLIVFDVGPNLGAINRVALLSSDNVVVPLGADLFSLQGLRNLGPMLRGWKKGWGTRIEKWTPPEFALPTGAMSPIGYVAMRHGVRLTRPVKAYTRWLDKIPEEYRRSVLGEEPTRVPAIDKDPHCLALLKNYASLMPLSQEARVPMFLLRAAHGAIGAHSAAVSDAYGDFQLLTKKIAKKMNLAA